MSIVPGTKGYEKVVEVFADASFNLYFENINSDFLQFLPQTPARVLDAGSGVGQNSAALAKRGYSVVSVEPLNDFQQIARAKYQDLNISWLNDSLPKLEKIDDSAGGFDFVLIDGVWHHLSKEERIECIRRLAEIVNVDGVCAISLRNGPAGAGTHVFPTCNDELVCYANKFGFQIVLLRENESSKMKNKPNVI